jgi:catalase
MTAFTTNEAGNPIPSDEHSLSVGPDGPILLQDHYLIEQMANFNRERIPERQPHAKGGGAYGVFEVTNDVSQYTRAAFLQPGVKTEMVARFSTVAGERGSPDTWRDPRGFALKFYTSEGNFDLVGNNTPVFFMRDPMKFQNFIRSQKRMQATNLRDHHMQWDFWTLVPESAHQVTWLMGDRGIPRTWRHMNGYSSHTYSWQNHNGELFWVKYHFKTDQGVDFLTQEDGDRLAGEDGDYHQRDLYTSIANGDFPSWTLKMQIMPFEDAKTYRINPFDLTKVWPHSDYPLIDVGKMTLNRNVTDYHAEIEQAAFEPNNIVPGTGLSPDKMLLARGFSYSDAHRARLGVNYRQIPVNTPKVEVHSYSKDGVMRIRKVTRRAPRRCTGCPTATWCGRPTPCGPRTTTGVRPGRWSATSSTTRNAIVWCTTSSGMSRRACASRCCRGCSSTGATSTLTSARRSRRASAPTATDRPTRGAPVRIPDRGALPSPRGLA